MYLASSYKNVLENKNYVFDKTFICTFLHLKMEASIWTALEGPLVSVTLEAIAAIHFCWKQKRGREESL